MNTAIIKQNIMKIVEQHPEAANSKPLLYALYYTNYGDWDSTKPLYDNFKNNVRPSTIDRRHRELREAGLIQLSKEREEEVIEAMRNERDKHSDYKAISWL